MKPIEIASYFVVTVFTCYSILRVGEAFEPLTAQPASRATSEAPSAPLTGHRDDDTNRKIETILPGSIED